MSQDGNGVLNTIWANLFACLFVLVILAAAFWTVFYMKSLVIGVMIVCVPLFLASALHIRMMRRRNEAVHASWWAFCLLMGGAAAAAALASLLNSAR